MSEAKCENEAPRNEQLLVTALARGNSQAGAAKASGWSRSSIRRRLQDPDFVAQIEETRRELSTRTMAKLVAAGCRAVATLEKLLDGESEMVRLGSARAILDHLLRYRESEELAIRVLGIEKALETTAASGNGKGAA